MRTFAEFWSELYNEWYKLNCVELEQSENHVRYCEEKECEMCVWLKNRYIPSVNREIKRLDEVGKYFIGTQC